VTVTLEQIEQATARRVGPYWRFFTDRQVPNTAQFTYANFPELRSSIDSDLVTNLWMLRRGETVTGTPVTVDPIDRQRVVDVYDTSQGRVFPERTWSVVPNPGEYVEFHHLDPAQELRPAVLSGLARCFMQDLVTAPPTWQYGGVDVTASFPWLTDAWQIARVQYGYWYPDHDVPFECVQQQGHLIVVGGGFSNGYLPQTLWVTCWRPHWSWVNGAESTTGPTNDTDTLSVDLSYASAAGAIEAWHLFPAKLFQAAAGNVQATREQAAQEFSRLANVYGPQRSREIGFSSTFGPRGGAVKIGI